MKIVLAPSILAADFNVLGEQIKETERAGAEYLHFDVMDGVFVPSISFGMPVLEAIRNTTDQVKDVHLMITEPIRYIEAFAKAGADLITIHLEACEDVQAAVDKIKGCGVKAGISIKPATPVSALEPFLEQIDMALIMTVEPGFGGQKFIPESLDKIRELRKRIEAKQLQVDIQVDGGLYVSNVRESIEAGANIIVAGSAVFKGDPAKNTAEFMEIFKEYE